MFAWFKSLFASKKHVVSLVPDPPPVEFRWCLVGNILHSRKQFSANTKVYCLDFGGGMGYENIKVIGLHKASKKLICIIISTKHIYNWRRQKVYSPQVLKIMEKEWGQWGDPSRIDSLAASFNNRGIV